MSSAVARRRCRIGPRRDARSWRCVDTAMLIAAAGFAAFRPNTGTETDRRPAAINIAVSTQRHDLASLRGPILQRLRATAEDISRLLRAT